MSAGQQRPTVEIAQIDQTEGKRAGMPFDSIRHAHRFAADIQYQLPGELTAQAVHAQAVFGHA